MTTPTYPFTDEGIESALQALDGRVHEVAEMLSKGGYRGVKGDECACPVARYLSASIPDATRVLVYLDEDGDAVIVAERTVERRGETVGGVAFGGVPEFVRRFDKGLYPDLILEES